MAMLRSDRSVYAFVSRYLRDEALRRVFSFQPFLVGGNPFHTTSIYSLIQHLELRVDHKQSHGNLSCSTRRSIHLRCHRSGMDGVHFAMGGIDWTREADRLEERILDILEATVCPETGFRFNPPCSKVRGSLP